MIRADTSGGIDQLPRHTPETRQCLQLNAETDDIDGEGSCSILEFIEASIAHALYFAIKVPTKFGGKSTPAFLLPSGAGASRAGKHMAASSTFRQQN